ncbi:MAG: methylmalonyl-CoA mutase family protein [Crocinitomicaceae bacterium]
MEKLFENFNKVNFEDWKNQIIKDLKGKPIEVLNSNPEMDIEIKAFHHNEEKSNFVSAVKKSNNDWVIRKEFSTESNDELLEDLNQGINGISVTAAQFKALTKDVLFEHIDTDITIDELDKTELPSSARLNFDIIGKAAKQGRSLKDLSEFSSFFKQYQNNSTIWVNGNLYGDAGATSIQELAFTAAHLNEYVNALVNEGVAIEDINKKINICLSITNNYFVNIAKMRVIRTLVNAIFKAYDSNYTTAPIHLVAKTSVRYQALNDANSNLLRQTTQAMSAVIGGCDALTINPLITGDKVQNDLNHRMAKNIQLILKEESYLDKVVDPSDGSYYLSDLSQQILTKSWDLFNEIEKAGGFLESLKNEHIQSKIADSRAYLIEQMNHQKATFLGVNKFQSSLENWTKAMVDKTQDGPDFKNIRPFKLEQYFQNKVEA